MACNRQAGCYFEQCFLDRESALRYAREHGRKEGLALNQTHLNVAGEWRGCLRYEEVLEKLREERMEIEARNGDS